MPPAIQCPICKAHVPWEGNPNRPFCSERCRLIDLGAWADERYRIPGKRLKERPKDSEDKDRDDGEESC